MERERKGKRGKEMIQPTNKGILNLTRQKDGSLSEVAFEFNCFNKDQPRNPHFETAHFFPSFEQI